MRTMPEPSGVRITSPSPPTPCRRSQVAAIRSRGHASGFCSRPSRKTKSFPEPVILKKEVMLEFPDQGAKSERPHHPDGFPHDALAHLALPLDPVGEDD